MDPVWGVIIGSVVGASAAIVSGVLAPAIRAKADRAAMEEDRLRRGAEERRAEIRRLVNETLAAGAAYQIAYPGKDVSVTSRHFVDFVRSISALDMWLTSEEKPVSEMLRKIVEKVAKDETAGQSLAFCGLIVSEWFRGDLSPLDARRKYDEMMTSVRV